MARRKSPSPSPTEVGRLLDRLELEFPGAGCSLDFRTPLELLVATVLSAQSTDRRVNLVTPSLFARFRSAADYAASPPGELEGFVRSTGFYNSKARALRGLGAAIVRDHGGKVPRTMDALTALPGVGRKTANVVLGNAFGIPDGVVVDTHVGRLARRFGWSRESDPAKVERDLSALIPRARWVSASHLLILHGRATCAARRPACERCVLADLCPKVGVKGA